MKQHKWHKEIKAWADGVEIEFKVDGKGEWALLKGTPYWECKNDLFRIKPQPKEPKYLYVYLDDNYELSTIPIDNDNWKYIGKIKLEVDDE
jgi:hypothetical protein